MGSLHHTGCTSKAQHSFGDIPGPRDGSSVCWFLVLCKPVADRCSGRAHKLPSAHQLTAHLVLPHRNVSNIIARRRREVAGSIPNAAADSLDHHLRRADSGDQDESVEHSDRGCAVVGPRTSSATAGLRGVLAQDASQGPHLRPPAQVSSAPLGNNDRRVSART